MRKILFVYDRMMTGGTTTALISLLNELNYNEYEVDLILYNNEGPFLPYIPNRVHLIEPAYQPKLPGKINGKYQKIFFFLLNGGPVKAVVSWCKHRNTPKGMFRDILAHHAVQAQVFLSRKLDNEYDAAIGFIEGWSDHYVLSKKVRAKKRIVWIHPDYMNSYLLPEVDRKPLERADQVILVSNSCAESFTQAFPKLCDKVKVIENIVSQDYLNKRTESEQAPEMKGDLKLGTVCRCDMRVKGLDRIIGALEKLRDEKLLNGVVWHLIGDGKDLPAVKELVRVAQLEECVVFHGHSDNPLPMVKQLDAFVLASRYEGKPVAVTEALCLGVPCIVTEYVSAKEQIQSGVNGLVSANNEQGIYEALKHILQNREYLRDLKEGVQQVMVSNTEEVQKLYAILRRAE